MGVAVGGCGVSTGEAVAGSRVGWAGGVVKRPSNFTGVGLKYGYSGARPAPAWPLMENGPQPASKVISESE